MAAGRARRGRPAERDAQRRTRLRGRDWVWLAVAAAAVLVGLGLRLAGGDEPASSGGGSGSGVAPSSLVAGGGGTSGGAGAAEEAGAAAWSPLFLKGGFSFFAGFAVGFALRTFFKLTLLVAGVLALALVGLDRAGLVEVDWGALGGAFEGLAERVRSEAGELRTLLTGSLPSAASGALGLVVGLRRG